VFQHVVVAAFEFAVFDARFAAEFDRDDVVDVAVLGAAVAAGMRAPAVARFDRSTHRGEPFTRRSTDVEDL
jgi:hypothetical protein